MRTKDTAAGTAFLTLALIVVLPKPASAWVYPEHRDISAAGIRNLDEQRQTTLMRIWTMARTGHESRLNESPVDTSGTLSPVFIDYAAWSAIAGDHSCSAENMVANILTTEWILEVAAIAARLKENLAGSIERHDRINYLRASDNELLRADPRYATRAGSNNVHFLLAREQVIMNSDDYALACVKNGAEMNAIGAYAWYHIAAMHKASLLRFGTDLDPVQRSQLALATLADEAFALHFLQDAFAAGHIAGTWGDASLRKGTHDYYNEHGLEVSTWDREAMVLLGDAYMRPEDKRLAARAVTASLNQVLDAASDTEKDIIVPDIGTPSGSPDGLNVCAVNRMPGFRDMSDRDLTTLRGIFINILRSTPIPGLTAGKGENPRFRAELGPFVGIAPAAMGSFIKGAFGEFQDKWGAVPSVEISARFGIGLEGVLNESGDGLVFLDIGYRQDGQASTSFVDFSALDNFGGLTSSIPSRSAITARLRLPFWLLPGDLLILGPVLLFASPETLTQVATQAGNGGLIPWQSGLATSFGRFQFILGREVGVSFFGHTGKTDDRFFLATSSDILVVGVQSIFFDFPVLEYRPFRSFSTTQSSSLALQLNAGMDIPVHVQVVSSELAGVPPDQVPVPDLNTVWHVGLRLVFDWRYYY